MNIGVFDSGLGGLSVFRELLVLLPKYNYIYLGDNARVPYGGRPNNVIYQFTKEAVNFLFRNDCEVVILACNTATAIALKLLQQEYLPKCYPGRRILGVIYPVAEYIHSEKLRRIGILATTATVASNYYPMLINKLSPDALVFQEACPLLTPLIEADKIETEEFESVLKTYLHPLLENGIDGLIPGSTHYGLITNKIRKYIPDSVKIILQGEITASKLMEYLERHPEIEEKLEKKFLRKYFATDINERFEKLTKIFLRKNHAAGVTLKLAQL